MPRKNPANYRPIVLSFGDEGDEDYEELVLELPSPTWNKDLTQSSADKQVSKSKVKPHRKKKRQPSNPPQEKQIRLSLAEELAPEPARD